MGKHFKILSEICDKKETFKTKKKKKDKCLTACPHTFFQGKKKPETSRLPHFGKLTLGGKKNKFPWKYR